MSHLGTFFSQKLYVSLISATLRIMEKVEKSSTDPTSLRGFEDRALCQFEPKLRIKSQDPYYHENNNI